MANDSFQSGYFHVCFCGAPKAPNDPFCCPNCYGALTADGGRGRGCNCNAKLLSLHLHDINDRLDMPPDVDYSVDIKRFERQYKRDAEQVRFVRCFGCEAIMLVAPYDYTSALDMASSVTRAPEPGDDSSLYAINRRFVLAQLYCAECYRNNDNYQGSHE